MRLNVATLEEFVPIARRNVFEKTGRHIKLPVKSCAPSEALDVRFFCKQAYWMSIWRLQIGSI
jgi:hypothetical protein